MKAVNAVYFAFAATVSANSFQARDSGSITLGLSNDLTRSYATAKFPTDSLNHSLGVYFGGTSVSVGGVVKASSAQLVDMPSSVSCVITNNGTTIATLTNENTYADLDGNPDESVAINLMGADITCHV